MGRLLIERSWLWRRLGIFTSLIVCDIIVLYLTIWGTDSRVNETLANGAFLTMAALVNGYIFGGALDDRNKDKAAVATQAVEQSEPTSTTVKVEQ